MPTNYQYATLNDALNALGSRLYDETFQQWSQGELTLLLQEALSTFNALADFWRAEMNFNLTQNRWWYDLRTVAGTIIPYSTTQAQIVTQIENHLLEPATPVYPLIWGGSQQFSISDILSACQRRQDDVLGTTGCTYSQAFVDAPIGGRILLPDTAIDIRRVAWIPALNATYSNKILRQSDMWAQRAFNPLYTVQGPTPPSVWMQNAEPPPSFDVDSTPPIPGQYDVLTVNAGPSWQSTTSALIPIAADWAWLLKWGALMDLLSRESNAKDALRADYCKRRYEQGLAMLENSATVLALRINNLPMQMDSVRNGDDFDPGWQALPAGPPSAAFVAGNQLAFPLSDNNVYGALVSVVQNAPLPGRFDPTTGALIPASLGDYVQISRDCFDAIIDETHHLAMFKQGGDEFAATVTLHQRFEKKAAEYSSKVREAGFFSFPQLDLSHLQEQQAARYLPDSGPTVSQ